MSKQATHFSDRCLYMLLSNGIHLIVLKQGSPEACDECFEQVEQIYRNAPPKQPILIAIDLRATELPPFVSSMRHVAGLKAHIPPETRRKVAFLYSQELIHPLVHFLMILLMSPRRRELHIFPSSQWNEATEWLLETRST